MDIDNLLGQATQLHNDFLGNMQQALDTIVNGKVPSLDSLVAERKKQIANMEAEVERAAKGADASSPFQRARIDSLNARIAVMKSEHQAMQDFAAKINIQP